MKKFRFRLQKVMEYKEEIEKQRKLDLSKAKQRLYDEEEKLKRLQYQDSAYRKQIQEKGKAERIDPREMDLYYQYLKALHVQMKHQNGCIIEAKEVMEEKRKILLEATKERKILEKLKEKKHVEYNSDTARRERFVLDDVTSTAFARRRIEQ
jgi:flagellar FliJ protein